ncbi:MAG: single-stranded DNA-binding protein [Patescibacteria group bacterium]
MSVRSLNKVMLIGNLTRDPQMRFTPTGTAVGTFGIATNRSWVPSDGGERQEETEFHNIVAWSKLAEICGSLLHKGDKVYVDGRIRSRDWKTKEGEDRRTTEIVIDNMMLLSSRNGGSYTPSDDGAMGMPADEALAEPVASKPKKAAPAAEPEPMEEIKVEDVSDDIPF